MHTFWGPFGLSKCMCRQHFDYVSIVCVCQEIRCRFSPEQRAHVLLPLRPDARGSTGQDKKWYQEAKPNFVQETEPSDVVCICFGEWAIRRWQNLWRTQPPATEGIHVTSQLAKHAGHIFFPNIRELLKVCAVSPLGGTESERPFSCAHRVFTWLEAQWPRKGFRICRHFYERSRSAE